MSRRFVSLEARGYFNALRRGVLGWQFHRQTLPPLLAATTQYFTPPTRRHPRPETMSSDAPLIPRAVCWLSHREMSPETLIRLSQRGGRIDR